MKAMLPTTVNLDSLEYELVSEDAGPEELAEQRELIAKAMALLTERERRYIQAIADGDTLDEIALREKKTRGAVKMVVERARVKVRAELGE